MCLMHAAANYWSRIDEWCRKDNFEASMNDKYCCILTDHIGWLVGSLNIIPVLVWTIFGYDQLNALRNWLGGCLLLDNGQTNSKDQSMWLSKIATWQLIVNYCSRCLFRARVIDANSSNSCCTKQFHNVIRSVLMIRHKLNTTSLHV